MSHQTFGPAAALPDTSAGILDPQIPCELRRSSLIMSAALPNLLTPPQFGQPASLQSSKKIKLSSASLKMAKPSV
jgi:hypothetical protein